MLDTFCEPCVPIADRLLLSDLSRPFLRAEFHRDVRVDPRRGFVRSSSICSTKFLAAVVLAIGFSSFHLSRLLLLSNKRVRASDGIQDSEASRTFAFEPFTSIALLSYLGFSALFEIRLLPPRTHEILALSRYSKYNATCYG